MGQRHRETFTMRDALILVATTAIPFLCLQATRRDGSRLWQVNPQFSQSSPWPSLYVAFTRFDLVAPSLLASSGLAVLILQWRRSGLTARQLSRGPGFAAGMALALALAFEMLLGFGCEALAINARNGFRSTFVEHGGSLTWLEKLKELARPAQWIEPDKIAAAILAAWGLLLVGRCWRWPRDRFDQLGMILGATWLVLAIFYRLVLAYLQP